MRDGGPAFPRAASTDEHSSPCNVYSDQRGMSLYEYTLIHTLSGILASGRPLFGSQVVDVNIEMAREYASKVVKCIDQDRE